MLETYSIEIITINNFYLDIFVLYPEIKKLLPENAEETDLSLFLTLSLHLIVNISITLRDTKKFLMKSVMALKIINDFCLNIFCLYSEIKKL